MQRLSRDAEIVAISFFGMGEKNRVTFRRPHIISERTMVGIRELLESNMICPMKIGDMPKGGAGWYATENIGMPMRDFKKPEESECWDLTEDDGVK